MGDLAEFTHFVTRLKIVPALADDVSLTEAERTRGRDFAAKLSMRVLARTWQMLLKGIAEVEAAGRPLAAAEMVLVRIAYAADLPTPDEVIRSLGEAASPGNGAGAATAAAMPAARAARGDARRVRRCRSALTRSAGRAVRRAPRWRRPRRPRCSEPRTADNTVPVRALASFEELVELAAEKRDLTMKSALERDVRLVRFEDGKLEIALEPERNADAGRRTVDETQRLDRAALDGRGLRRAGRADVRAQAEARKAELKDGVRADPLVQAVLANFPGAEIVAVRPPAGAAEPIR